MGQLPSFLGKRKDTQEITADEIVTLISQSNYCIALTGAGASAESNVPTFRNPYDGIWKKHSMMTCGTIQGFKSQPDKLWRLIIDCVKTLDPKPNPTHLGLTKLEKLGKLKSIITQNIDHLHQDAGTQNVIELHGNLMQTKCMSCGKITELRKKFILELTDDLPPRCSDCNNGIMKPAVILFGESLPSNAIYRAYEESKKCDLFLVIGTNATVSPACDLPGVASSHGAKVIEINLERTRLTNRISDYIFLHKSSELGYIADEVEKTTNGFK